MSDLYKLFYSHKSVRQTLYLLVICGISAVFWSLDHRPEFYMGDSASYVRTAVEEYIPPDRSFVYGFIIRWIALPFRSLKPLMIAQGVAGILSCAGLAICLKRYATVNVDNATCFLMVLLFCVEPMHMMFQRYVLTEALTMPIFIAYLMASMSYLKKRRLIQLAILQVLGIALISMRLIFLPLVLINAVILPLLMSRNCFRQAFAHVLTNLFLILVLHGGYCMLNGKLSNAPPGYTYYDGFFALSAWAPAVTVSSAANPQVAEIIRRGSEYDLNKFPRRYYQLWDAQGIVFRIKGIAPDLVTANRWAKITARRAFAQNPVAVLTVALKTYIEFNTYEKIQNELRIDRGDDIPVRKNLVKWLKKKFSADTHEFIEQDGEYWQLPSVTKLIQNHAAPWMLLLVQTPWLCLVGAALNKDGRPFFLYLSAVCFIYIVTVCFLTPLVITRLLYPLTVPFFLLAGWMIAFAKATWLPILNTTEMQRKKHPFARPGKLTDRLHIRTTPGITTGSEHFIRMISTTMTRQKKLSEPVKRYPNISKDFHCIMNFHSLMKNAHSQLFARGKLAKAQTGFIHYCFRTRRNCLLYAGGGRRKTLELSPERI